MHVYNISFAFFMNYKSVETSFYNIFVKSRSSPEKTLEKFMLMNINPADD